MSPDLERLIDLQHLVSVIDEAERVLAAFPDRVAALDEQVASGQQRVDAAAEGLAANKQRRQEFEKKAAVFQGRLTKFKDQLSSVKTNREFQAMQHEIETAETELAAAEERILESMLEADGLTSVVREAETALATTRKDVDAQKALLAAERSVSEETLAKTTEARDALVATLTPQTVELFEQLSKARKGVALSAATKDGLCGVCHVRLRPVVFQEVRANNAIIQCESCRRILYYLPPVGATPSTAASPPPA